ncbi:hypothetical protein LXL04_001096 [Taraxacum kok-saghyz]
MRATSFGYRHFPVVNNENFKLCCCKGINNVFRSIYRFGGGQLQLLSSTLGLLIRFIKASTAYLGQSTDSVVVDFNYYRADSGTTPRLNQDVMEEVEQMAFVKYGARPHWAKNRKVAFSKMVVFYGNSLSLELVSSILYLHIAALYCILLHIYGFVAAKMKLDPNDVFSSESSDELLFGRKGENDFDGCGLEGECVCSEHRHCSPTNGYFVDLGLFTKKHVFVDIHHHHSQMSIWVCFFVDIHHHHSQRKHVLLVDVLPLSNNKFPNNLGSILREKKFKV